VPIPDASTLDLTQLIRPGDTIMVGQGTAEALGLTARLVEQAPAIGPLTVFLGPLFSKTFAPDAANEIRFISYNAAGGAAALIKAGRLDMLPAPYSTIPRLFETGVQRADVALLQLGRESGPGRINLGQINDYALAAARRARLVIGEVNEHVPMTNGADIDDLRVDLFVASSLPPAPPPASRSGAAEDKIAAHVASLVPNGATIQMGIGAIPDAILTALKGHRDLGLHSGMITDRVADLMEAGVITNARKTFDQGVGITGVMFGTERLNRFAHRNPALRLAPPAYTHGIDVLARIPHFVAMNSAIEVDLTGQCNTEVANGAYVGAVGGLPDFVRGGHTAPGGRSIIALPSTAGQGSISRVVPALASVPVTVTRSDADIVVTEWGIAELRGCTLGERARRMIQVAHPDFREALARAAHKGMET
jgi:acetyl-CoA hydrolase